MSTKENFCAPCATGVAALLGASISGSTFIGSKKDREKQKKIRKILFWVGVGITLLSIVIGVYFLCRKEKCKGCESDIELVHRKRR